MVILKFLFFVFVFFYIIALLGRFFIKRFVKKNQEHFNNQKGRQNSGDQKNKKHRKGETYIEYKPNEKKNIPDDEGEYVDYEEIK